MIVLLFLIVTFALPAAQNTSKPEWKAGVATVEITPTESIWMAGYASRTKPSEGVRGSLFAKALVLEDRDGSVNAIVTYDLLYMKKDVGDAIAARVSEELGISRARLLLNASHTHGGPVIGLAPRKPEQAMVARYSARLVNQTVELIGAALKNRAPAMLSFEQGLAGFAVNRRRDHGRRSLPGPVDHDVPVMAVRGESGALRVMLFGYACHATAYADYLIFGDWPSLAQEELQKLYPAAVAMFMNGCGADANPLPRRSHYSQTEDSTRRGQELVRMYGRIMAEAVSLVIEGGQPAGNHKMKPVRGPLRAAYDKVVLPLQKVPSRAEFEQRLKHGATKRLRDNARDMLAILDRGESLRGHYDYPVQVWQFGPDLKLIALGGEVVVDYALLFKGKYGWDNTWVAGYSNDVFSYVPSLRVLREGGYEGGEAMLSSGFPAMFTESVEYLIGGLVEQLVAKTKF